MNAQPDITDDELEFVRHRIRTARIDGKGREILDPNPMAPPIGYIKQESLHEQIARMVRSERLRQEADAAGFETFDEADDFDIGDDYDPSSSFEEQFYGQFTMPPEASAKAPTSPEKGQGAPPAEGGAEGGLEAS